MNVLIIYTHPIETSFNHSVLEAVKEGLAEAGHEVKIADLYAENFQSAMTKQDFAQFEDLPMPPEIEAEKERVEWSDALVFVFPIWWWSMPGMLKGWIDRVMHYGWAWVDPSDPESGHLRNRKILVLATAGDSPEGFAKRGYDIAFHTQLNVGTWSYCGFKNVTTRIFHDLHHKTPQAVRENYLIEARKLAQDFL